MLLMNNKCRGQCHALHSLPRCRGQCHALHSLPRCREHCIVTINAGDNAMLCTHFLAAESIASSPSMPIASHPRSRSKGIASPVPHPTSTATVPDREGTLAATTSSIPDQGRHFACFRRCVATSPASSVPTISGGAGGDREDGGC
jgi:hypothetical protein